MLLLTYDPNVKPTLPEYVPEGPVFNYSVSLVSPYFSEARMAEIRQQLFNATWLMFALSFPRAKEE